MALTPQGIIRVPQGTRRIPQPTGPLSSAALDLYFAGNQYYDGAYEVPSAIFTVVNSTGGFVWDSAGNFSLVAANTLRRSNLGTLAEGARTQLTQQNTDGSNAAWTKVSQNVTAGQPSPDGGTSAFVLTNIVASSAHSCNAASVAFTSGTKYRIHGIFKGGTDTRIQMAFGNAAFSGGPSANFDLSGSGSLGSTTSSPLTSGCLPYGNTGWFFCFLSAQATSTTSTGAMSIIRIAANNSARNPTYTPGSTDTVFVWAPTCELDPNSSLVPVSPILNATGGSLAQSADNITITGAAATAAVYAAQSAYSEIYSCAAGTTNVACNINAALLQASSATTMQTNNGTLNAEATISAAGSIAGLVKTAHNFDGMNLTAIANAGTLATTAATWGAVSGTIQVGNNAALTRPVAGFIRRLSFSATANKFSSNTSLLPQWQASKALQVAGIRNAKILFLGDSTTAGWGSQNSSAHVNDAALGTIAQLSALLPGASWQSQFCDQNTLSGAAGTIPINVFDARVTLGSFVQTLYAGGVAASVGGSLLTCSSGTTAYTFTPTTNVDTFDFYYATDPTFGHLSYQVDSGAVVDIDCSPAQSVTKVTISAGSVGAHTLKIARVSGSVQFVGTIAYTAAVKEITIINGGWSGSTAANWNVINGAWDPLLFIPQLAPDLTIIDLTINDWVAATLPATYRASMQALMAVAARTGDVLLLSGVPSNTGSASLVNQSSKLADYATLANIAGLYNVNQTTLFTSWSAANAAGYTFDNLHYNSTGYAVTAAALAALL